MTGTHVNRGVMPTHPVAFHVGLQRAVQVRSSRLIQQLRVLRLADDTASQQAPYRIHQPSGVRRIGRGGSNRAQQLLNYKGVVVGLGELALHAL